jgi:hypothetical protein
MRTSEEGGGPAVRILAAQVRLHYFVNRQRGPGPDVQLVAYAIVGWACTAAIANIVGKPVTAAAKLLAFSPVSSSTTWPTFRSRRCSLDSGSRSELSALMRSPFT